VQPADHAPGSSTASSSSCSSGGQIAGLDLLREPRVPEHRGVAAQHAEQLLAVVGVDEDRSALLQLGQVRSYSALMSDNVRLRAGEGNIPRYGGGHVEMSTSHRQQEPRIVGST
jgi:hypothetical protein